MVSNWFFQSYLIDFLSFDAGSAHACHCRLKFYLSGAVSGFGILLKPIFAFYA